MKYVKYLHDNTHAYAILNEVLILLISQPDQTQERGDKERNMPD